MKSILLILVGVMLLLGLGGCALQGDGDQGEGALFQEALAQYFALLNEGDYAGAAELYGGDYSVLIDWNPTVDPADRAHLLELGCTTNGLQCLAVRSIQAGQPVGSDRFEFTVQFENPDGTLFNRQTGDGSEEESVAQSEFVYTVVRSGDGFAVLELPVYVP